MELAFLVAVVVCSIPILGVCSHFITIYAHLTGSVSKPNITYFYAPQKHRIEFSILGHYGPNQLRNRKETKRSNIFGP